MQMFSILAIFLEVPLHEDSVTHHQLSKPCTTLDQESRVPSRVSLRLEEPRPGEGSMSDGAATVPVLGRRDRPA